MVHVHVRDENGKPTWDPKKYAEVLEGTRKYCPDMLLQFTTGKLRILENTTLMYTKLVYSLTITYSYFR